MPSHLTIHSRADWGAHAPTCAEADEFPGEIRELFIHWVGTTPMRHVATSQEEEKAQLRAIQHYHQATHGWCDIGYSFVLCPPWGRKLHAGNIYEGRGLRHVPAGQLGHNTDTLALLVLMGGDDPVDERLIERLRAFKRWADEECGHSLAVRPHSAVVQTDCPGPHLRAIIHRLQDV